MPRSSKKPKITLAQAAVEVVGKLAAAGYEAYLAGGCVRDRLLDLEPDDYDVATDARPDAIGELFRKARHVGESFGVMLVFHQGHRIQVATFRTDGVYSDGRHPDTVVFSDAEHDARRRDFTINGLFENPLTNDVIDFVGGQDDLRTRLIRAIGEPEARLREDRLRTLRAVRFAARFGFAIEPATAEAIRAAATELPGVSRERIGQELKRMLADPSRAVAAGQLQALGLDAVVLDEPAVAAGLTRLEGLPEGAAYPTALAAWLLDRHEEAGDDPAARAARWSKALLLSNVEQSELTRCLVAYRTLRHGWSGLGVAGQKRLAAGPQFGEALSLLDPTDPAAAGEVRRRVEVLSASGLAPRLLIDGRDLIELGLTPGPLFKEVLDAVYDAQLEGAVTDRPGAIDLARRLGGGSHAT